jgi:SPP1 family predicted phage head-tail adaptor
MTKARKYRHRITFLATSGSSRVDDGWGGNASSGDTDETTLQSVWASIEPLKMDEISESYRSYAEATHQIKLRYIPGITPDMQINYKTRTFFVNSVINEGELDKELILICTEEV